MYLSRISAIFVALGLLTTTVSQAESFKILGSRALGMAGAYVAIAEDSNALYWNPAAIAEQENFDTEITAGVRAEATGGLLKDVNTISDFSSKYKAIQSAQSNGTSINADQFASIFTTLKILNNLNQPGKGVLVDANAGFGTRIMRLGFSFNNFVSIGANPFIDTKNIGLGTVTNSNAAKGFSSAFGASGNLTGISFAGVDIGAPSDADLLSARNSVVDAINTVGFSALKTLIGQQALDAGGITTVDQLANAVINEAKRQNLSNTQIISASNDLKTQAPEVKETIQSAAASNNGYSNNTSNVTFRGISLFEAGVSYGHRFFIDDLYVGGSLKVLHGTVGYFQKRFLGDDVAGKDIFNDVKNNSKSTVQPGVDLGVLYDKRESYRLKFGLLARNINYPSFDQPDGATGESKYTVNPQIRAGVALYPFKRKFWVISADIDATENNTPLPGFESRYWALGTEINLVNSNWFNLALRGGITSNLSEKNSKLAYAGGVGLKILHFFVDVSGSISSEKESIKDGSGTVQDVPQNAQVGISLGLNF